MGLENLRNNFKKKFYKICDKKWTYNILVTFSKKSKKARTLKYEWLFWVNFEKFLDKWKIECSAGSERAQDHAHKDFDWLELCINFSYFVLKNFLVSLKTEWPH